MNSEEDIAGAAESLVSTLKRLHEELLGFDALLQERGAAYPVDSGDGHNGSRSRFEGR